MLSRLSPRSMAKRRMARLTRSQTSGRLGGDITPMIDVVFLLLIFFMCTLDFKKLESKLTAHLPADRGIAQNFELLKPVEEMRIHLSMNGDRCICRLNGRSLGVLPGVRSALFAKLDRLKRVDPESPAIVSVDPTVPHKHVVTTIDECTRADVSQITFAAALPDLKRR